MTSEKEPVEQRQRKRYRVLGDVVVVFRAPDVGTGLLIDISMGGLTFDLVTGQVLAVQATKLDICQIASSFTLYDLPCLSIWELSIYEKHPTSLHRKRCGVKFGELTESQKDRLRYFIEHHTTGEV